MTLQEMSDKFEKVNDTFIEKEALDYLGLDFIKHNTDKHVIGNKENEPKSMTVFTIHKPWKSVWTDIGPRQSFLCLRITWNKLYENDNFYYVPFITCPNLNA